MSAKSVYDNFQPQLLNMLPIKDPFILANLDKEEFFTGDLRDRVMAAGTKAQAVTILLDEAISPYIQDNFVDLGPLNKLLKVMEGYGGPAKSLAGRIKAQMAAFDTGEPEGSTMIRGSKLFAKSVYDNFQPQLLQMLPVKDPIFIVHLDKEQLFTGDLRGRMQSPMLTKAQAATILLDEAISPYIQDDFVDLEPLNKLLKVMEGYGGPAKSLAGRIKAQMASFDTGEPEGSSTMIREPSICITALGKILANYAQLSRVNTTSLLDHLFAAKVIDSNQMANIQSITVEHEKMRYLLDNIVIPSLAAGVIGKFKGFLQVLEQSGDVTTATVGARLGNSQDYEQ